MRREFSRKTKDSLAKRVGFLCSNPDCQKLTVGPNQQNDKVTSVGVAAHIIAASPDGPRSDNNKKDNEITDIENGIWLCSNCSYLIDRNEGKYTVELLKTWKKEAENHAEQRIATNRSIDKSIILFDGYEFDSALEASWAAFFKLIDWSYVYKPLTIQDWQPKFHISGSLSEIDFLVDVVYSKDFTTDYRKMVGKSTNYRKGILVVNEHPFIQNGTFPNSIGMLSLEGMIENNDQEYCSSIVYDFFGEGVGIHNLCDLDVELFELIDSENEFCIDLWKKGKNLINQCTKRK